MAKKKAEAISEQSIQVILEKSINTRVDIRVDGAMPKIAERVFKRVTQASEPLGAKTTSLIAPSLLEPERSQLDWTTDMLPPKDQGNEGSSVGAAMAATLEFYLFKATGSHIALSMRDIYNEARAKAGTLAYDGGLTYADALEFLRTKGVVEERAWPYRAGEYAAERLP